jgi:hypothetical protein
MQGIVMNKFCLVVLRYATLLLVFGASFSAAAQTALLRSPDGGDVRGLIVGINAYRHVPALKGAVADARDIDAAMRSMGVSDITTLIDEKADRASILMAIDRMVQRTRQNDLIILSIAGHGTLEPERDRSSAPDGMESVFLLPDFEPTASGSQQRILGKELKHFIKQFELKGAKVLFVADTCYGGGMVRAVDPRAGEMSFRHVPTYTLSEDLLNPVSNREDELATELDFDHTAFLAAVDRQTKAPEIRIPGIPELRGALSYAFARAISGAADIDGDGKTTVKELFANVRQIVYQLSDQRQNVVTLTSPGRATATDVAFLTTRGITTSARPDAEGQQAALPAAPATAPVPSQSVPTNVPPATATSRSMRPVRIAALDGRSAQFAGLTPRESPFEIVQPTDNPDIVWDPVSHDVIAWGDVIAYNINKADLLNVIDRTAAIRDFKQMATKTPQSVRMAPNDDLHRQEAIVQIQLSDAMRRSVVLFNVSGDGTVQLLYPIGSDPNVLAEPDLRLPLRVREPFGAEQVIVVSSQQRMPELEQALLQLNRRRAAGQMVKMVQRYAPPDARIGSIGFFSSP